MTASLPWVRTTEAPSPTPTSVSVVSGPIAQPGPPTQVAPSSWVRGDDGVAADLHIDVDPGAGRVDDGDPGALVGGDDAAVEFAGQFRQLHPVVDPGHQCGVVDVLGVHDLAVGAHDAMTSVRYSSCWALLDDSRLNAERSAAMSKA